MLHSVANIEMCPLRANLPSHVRLGLGNATKLGYEKVIKGLESDEDLCRTRGRHALIPLGYGFVPRQGRGNYDKNESDFHKVRETLSVLRQNSQKVTY